MRQSMLIISQPDKPTYACDGCGVWRNQDIPASVEWRGYIATFCERCKEIGAPDAWLRHVKSVEPRLRDVVKDEA